MKNFINYLSKKSLSLGNGSGMTRKWFGNGSGMTRFSLVSLICLCMLTVGVGNVCGATATIQGTCWGTAASSYQTNVRSFTDEQDNTWKATGYGVTANTNIIIGKGGANYLETPNFSGNISSIAVTWSGNTSYYLALQTTNGTELDAHQNPSSATEYTFKVSGDYKQLRLVGRRNRGTSNAAATITKVVVTYGSSCTPLSMSEVTATAGNAQISLSWPSVANASSYTVTCKVKSSGSSAGTIGGVSGSGTKTCTITGLSNGTEYTWSVMPVGAGSYCADNTPASGDATPNVFRTITYYDKDGQHTTSLADGTNIATALTTLYGGDDPVSCDATNYEYFVGWKVGEISGTASSVTLLDDEVVNASSPSNNYYAVWSDTDPSAGGWTKVTSISVGDVVVFAYDDAYKEMTSVTTTGTTYGSATAVDPYPDDLSGDYALTVEAGNGGTGYSFKHGSVYLSWSSGNSLTTSSTKDDASSWTISESSSGNFKFANVGTTARILQYNSGSPRWACYTSSQKAFQIYKQSVGGDAEYITTCGSTYTITLAGSPAGTVTGGTFSASAASASAGTVITLTANPSRGYEFGSWTVTDASSNPVSVSNNQFTMPASNVTVSATFNTATPLTITLNTNGKGTYTDPAEWPIYAGESFTLPDVTPSDPTCATFVGWIQGTTFPGDATTHDAPLTISAGSSSGELSVNTTYTAVFYETETAESDAYVKVTSAPVNWANDHYLIVYEDGGVAFDGSLSTLDASSNTVDVSISSGAIAATSALAASEWKIALISGSSYSIQSASGKYIGNASNSNGLTADNTALGNTLSFSSENFGVVSAGGAYLRYNATSGQERFRYYKSSTYSSQQAIQLYKLGTAVVETRTYTTNPACTPKYRVTVASVTGGSPNANPKFLPENEEVTLTANPAAGYSFTGWTITKTTGGNDVTTTLLGANATTANTSFSMPAYDVTVTASYAKIPVASLQVKDGETVIANSGTVNISTGANKTLTVVVTPADAFDHSWSASVTGGGTYASITNVQAGTFQVNGLAQGDATVTVTAPNDGDAKTVTFTVHVTDILPTEVVLKRDGSNTSISELSIYEGQYVKVNVSFTPTPTNKDFSVSADGTFVTIHAQAHTNPNYYATLNGKKVTTSPVNVTFTSAATSSVTKNLVVTVLPLLTDTFVDYIHGQATQTVSARLSADKFTLYTDINTPSLSDASDADPTSADCETSHYHLIGWLPKATAEALWAAGTAITESTEGLVKAGVQVEAIGQTWYAIWGKEQ